MTEFELFSGFSGLDDTLLERSERRKQRAPLRKWGAMAACFCVIAAAAALTLPRLVKQQPDPAPEEAALLPSENCTPGPDLPASPGGEGETPVVPGGTPLTPDVPGSDAPTEQAQPALPTSELVFNELEDGMVADAVPLANVCLVGEELTPEELASAAPAVLLEWMEPSGAAIYYGWGELESLCLEFPSARWDGKVSVRIADPETPVYNCCLLPEEEIAQSTLGNLSVTAYQYVQGGATMLWVDFTRENVIYRLSVNCDLEDLEAARADLTEVAQCYAGTPTVPDLSQFAMREPHTLIDEQLTQQEALDDPDFGAYFLPAPPDGFAEESIRRYQKDDEQNYLSGLWTSGMAELRWKVCYLEEGDEARITDVDALENYDLSLYPIPRAESVPPELWEIVDCPIFRAGELTLDAVQRRTYSVQEGGDIAGPRMRFAVAYGDLLVEVSAKGVAPDWIFAALTQLS